MFFLHPGLGDPLSGVASAHRPEHHFLGNLMLDQIANEPVEQVAFALAFGSLQAGEELSEFIMVMAKNVDDPLSHYLRLHSVSATLFVPTTTRTNSLGGCRSGGRPSAIRARPELGGRTVPSLRATPAGWSRFRDEAG